jgi:hypothetical protein
MRHNTIITYTPIYIPVSLHFYAPGAVTSGHLALGYQTHCTASQNFVSVRHDDDILWAQVELVEASEGRLGTNSQKSVP